MNLTPPALLTELKRMNRDNLRSRAVIQHEVSIPQPGAGSQRRWVDRLPTALPCRVSAPAAADQERLLAAKVEATRACWVVYEDGADVRLTDRFIVTTEVGNTLIVYPIGGGFPRDAEVMRKMLCEVRGE